MFGFGILTMAFSDWQARRRKDKELRCDICNKVFDSIRDAKKHMNAVHHVRDATGT
jgi:uncharacterized C2H2 Zn-finger protein